MDYKTLIDSINTRVKEGKFFSKLVYPHYGYDGEDDEWPRVDNLLIFQSKELPCNKYRVIVPECTLLLDNSIRFSRTRQGIGTTVDKVVDLTFEDYDDFKKALLRSGYIYNRKLNKFIDVQKR